MGYSHVSRLTDTQSVLLATAQNDDGPRLEVPEGFETEWDDLGRIVRILAMTLGGQILGVPSPPLPALALLVASFALVMDAKKTTNPGDAGIGERAAGGIVAHPSCPDSLRRDTPFFKVGELATVQECPMRPDGLLPSSHRTILPTRRRSVP